MVYFISGAAGFIGYFLSKKLLQSGSSVIGFDSLNDYYSVELKNLRLKELCRHPSFSFFKGNLEDLDLLNKIFSEHKIDRVINLAAQAGVRYSITHPHKYSSANLYGFLNILEICREYKPEHFMFASSSSVYGSNKKTPYCETDAVDHPVSFYAATKRSGELMAHAYSTLFGIPATGLRFFTVYGPCGRPDMAYFKFAEKILAGKSIEVYNDGNLFRDFTYIDDVVKAIVKLADYPPEAKPQYLNEQAPSDSSDAPFEIYNIGNEHPEKLLYFIELLEKHLGKKSIKKFMPMQAGDVYITAADTDKLYKKINWKPSTTLNEGLKSFADWFLAYRNT